MSHKALKRKCSLGLEGVVIRAQLLLQGGSADGALAATFK